MDGSDTPLALHCAARADPVARRAGQLLLTGDVSGNVDFARAADPIEEIEAAFARLTDVLATNGASPEHVAQVHVWLDETCDRPAVERAWSRMFPDPADSPARHFVARAFADGRRIALEAVAVPDATRRTISHVPGIGRPAGDEAPLATTARGFLFAPAIAGYRSDGGLPDDPGEQADQAFANLRALVACAGFSHDECAHMFVWQRDHSLRQRVNDPWADTFPDKFRRPARHAVQMELGGPALRLGLLAVKGEPRMTLTQLHGISHTAQREPGFLPISASRGDYLFTGATFGADPKTGTFIEDGDEQVRSAFSLTLDILKAHGFTPRDVAHAIVWHKGDGYRTILDPLWEATFPDPETRPVRHDVPSALPSVLTMQIELIAARPGASTI